MKKQSLEMIPKSYTYVKKKTEVEAFLFDGWLRKDGEWLVPDWMVEAIESGIVYYINHFNYDTDSGDKLESDNETKDGTVSCDCDGTCNCNCSCKEDSNTEELEKYKFPKNIFTLSIFIKMKGDITREVTMESSCYLVKDSEGNIFPCGEKEFKVSYSEIKKSVHLKRVDILPEYYKDDLFPLKGEWIYVPPETFHMGLGRRKVSEYYIIRCSTCGIGFKVKNTKENNFTKIIAPRHFCSNCGSEMQNSDLPKRGVRKDVRR